MKPEDLYEVRYANEPQVSPDGGRVAWVETRADREANDYRAHLWLAAPDGSGYRRLTAGDSRDRFPRWSPDGRRIAFLRRDQVWVIAPDGGEAVQVTHGNPVSGPPAWSPDGRHITYVSRPGDLATDVRVYTGLDYKVDGGGLNDARPAQVWVTSLEGGAPRQVTRSPRDCSHPAWSPDGRFIAHSVAASLGTALWLVPAAGGDAVQLTDRAALPGCAFSPDGRRLAFTGDGVYRSGRHWHVLAVPVEGGGAEDLTPGWDRSAWDAVKSDIAFPADAVPVWTAEGVYFLGTDRGSVHVYAARGGEVRRVTPAERQVVNAFHVGGGTLAFAASSPARCDNIFTLAGRLTDVNPHLPAAEPEHLQWTSPDGLAMEGWLLRSKVPGPRPLILSIHGGPHSAYGWAYTFQFQMWAQGGYHVLYVNPRGSDGYGLAFTKACLHDWGGGDAQDILDGLGVALQRGGVDPARVGVTGGSYGGFMTNWLVSHDAAGRFRAAVTENCISNLVSFSGTSDIGYWFAFNQLGGDVLDDPDVLWRFSPLKYVKGVRIPMLVTHCEDDHRCPIEQGEQWYTALRRLGRETLFVRFPGESHSMGRLGQIRHRVERLQHLNDWWDRHLKG